MKTEKKVVFFLVPAAQQSSENLTKVSKVVSNPGQFLSLFVWSRLTFDPEETLSRTYPNPNPNLLIAGLVGSGTGMERTTETVFCSNLLVPS